MKRFWKIFICAFAAILIICGFETEAKAAAGGSCGSGVNWSYENGTLTISGSGRMKDMSRNTQPWRSFKDSATNIVIEEGITYIGTEAFYEMANVKTASLPDTLTEIGDAAFCWCEGLQTIDIPGSVKVIGEDAFWCCLDLTEVTFHEGLVEIEKEAFNSCRLLTRVDFPESLEKIGYWTFGGCSDLLHVSMPGVKDLGESCFSACTKLVSVELGKELEDIKTSAFAYCYALQNVVIPGSVDSVGDTAFYLCESLGTIKFTGSVPEISETAFIGAYAEGKYPECNTEWETVYGNGFGGTISWSSYSVSDHVYSESVVEETCLRWGYTVHTCTDCGEYYMSDYHSALGHNWNGGVVSGSKTTYTCQRCGLQRYEYSISGSCGSNARWVLDTEEGTLSITGTGGITSSSGFKNYKDSIRFVTIASGITSIGAETFFEFEKIESIDIPDTVKSIGMQAFVWCSSLKEIIVPEGVTAIYDSTFWGCQSLEKLVLPSTLKSIGKECFYKCDDLKTLYIPDNVDSISELAFWYCRGLEEVNIPKGIKRIPTDCFTSCTGLKTVHMHDEIEIIGEDAFDGCSALTEITIPESVHTIESGAFWGCTSLKEIVVPGSVMRIDEYAFGNCANLNNIKFTGNPPAFQENVFANTKTNALYREGSSAWHPSIRLQYGGTITWKTFSIVGHPFASEVVAPRCEQWGYTKYSCIDCDEYYMADYTDPIGHDWVFSHSASNYSIYICNNCGGEKKVYEVGGSCGSGLYWKLNTEEGVLKIYGSGSMNNMGRDSQPWASYKDCITKVIIESGARSIGSYAFYEHPALISVEIPDTVKSIGLGAFAWSQLLDEITIPDGVTSIPEDCFWACTALNTINLPDSIRTIGQGAFYYTAITSINLSDKITDMGEDAFWYCTNLKSVKIPKNVTVLRETIFSSCSSLTSVTLHDNITEIQRSAFSHCQSLTSITLPKKLEVLGESAFSGARITKITFPENLRTIDGYVFGGSVKEVHFLGNSPEFDAKTFNGATATAYYPAGSFSWNGKLLNYGGTITWKTEPCSHFLTEEYIYDATCVQEGYTEVVCYICGYSYISEYFGFGEHLMGKWETLVEPTETELGEQQRKCVYCDYTEFRKISIGGFIMGDLNLDGEINVMDAYTARLIAAKIYKPTDEQILIGDVDLDGRITAIDANIIRKFVAKIIIEIPVET